MMVSYGGAMAWGLPFPHGVLRERQDALSSDPGIWRPEGIAPIVYVPETIVGW